MITVSQILREKGDHTWSVSPDTKVFDALKMMAEKNIGAILVQDGNTLVGIFSERDYARKVILRGKASKEIPVREIMTAEVLYVRPSQTIEEVMALMTSKRIRHLPVMEENKVLGVISIGDVVKALISEQEFTIKQLENYITGGR